MPLTLSDAELACLERCATILLAPLDYPNSDAWRAAVNASARAIVNADSAVFDFAPLGRPLGSYSDDAPPEFLALRAATLAPAPDVPDVGLQRASARAIEVFNTTELVAGDWDSYAADPVMAEVQRHGLRDGLGMISWATPGQPAAVLQLNRRRYGTEAFGARGVLMFRLLRPAFIAGVRAMREFGARREGLAAALDASGGALVVHNEAGRPLHATPRVAQLLAQEPQRRAVEEGVARLARDLAQRMSRHRHAERVTPAQPVLKVRTTLGTYTLSAFLTAPGFFGAQPALIVALERTPPGVLADAALREGFGLSTREVEVARLMATGLSNRAIAEQLGLSPHTVRHHGERVFDKLGVKARGDIAAKLRAD